MSGPLRRSHTNRDRASDRERPLSEGRSDGPSSRGGHALDAAGSEMRLDRRSDTQISKVVEAEIIPRLMLAARVGDAVQTRGRGVVRPSDVEMLVAHALANDVESAYASVIAARDRGVRQEAILLELIAAAARSLGRRWDDDLCSFTDVTLALTVLHRVMGRLGVPPDTQVAGRRGRVLLSVADGEQHTLGLAMVAAFVRAAGWDVRREGDASAAELEALVAAEWFDVVGFSASSVNVVDRLTRQIQELRAASLNDHVSVIVGGAIYSQFQTPGDLAARVGADAAASDARHAAVLLETLARDAKAPA